MSEANTPTSPTASDIDTEVAAAMAASGESIEALLATKANPAPEGEEVPAARHLKRGRVAALRGGDVFVDILEGSGKLQGVVPADQFEHPPRIGSIMDFVVNSVETANGLMLLSREGTIGKTSWDTLAKGQAVEARVTGFNKGGLELELLGGVKAFMPAGQVDVNYIENLEQFVGQKMQATVTEVDRKHKKVMLSRRTLVEKDRRAGRDKVLSTLEVGHMVEGTVTKIMPFGAFIDIGGVDGMLHISEVSHSHIANMNAAVKVGDKVRVKVTKIEKDDKKGGGGRDKIALSLKATLSDPWDSLESRIQVGGQVEGLVTRTMDFGAFVEIEAGIEALIPVSELSHKFVAKVEDVIKKGDKLKFTVSQIDLGKRQIRLTLKTAQANPWTAAEAKYTQDSKHEGKIVAIKEFGAFVELEDGIEGMVHISQIADQRVEKIEDFLKVGEIKTFRIAGFDAEKRKISLSLKEPQAGGENKGGSFGGKPGAGKPSGGFGGGRGRAKEEVAIVKGPAVAKLPASALKGGMELRGSGLGSFKL